MEKLKKEFNAIDRMKIFEIEVINNNNEQDWIVCDISIQDNFMVAQRDSVSVKENESNLIATTKVKLNDCFSIDEHIQELHSKVIEDIINGDLFELPLN